MLELMIMSKQMINVLATTIYLILSICVIIFQPINENFNFVFLAILTILLSCFRRLSKKYFKQ